MIKHKIQIMSSLSKTNAATFLALIKSLGDKDSKTFTSNFWMPLTLQRKSKLNNTFGNAEMYVLFHHIKRKGKITLGPAMHFLFMKTNTINSEPDLIFPITYRMDAENACEESIEFEDGGIMLINPDLQDKHARLANDWMKMIRVRGYVQ